MPEYYANSLSKYNKDKFYIALKKEYKEHDQETLKVSYNFLNRIIAQSQAICITIKTYINLFYKVLIELVKKNKLNSKYQYKEFIKGLLLQVKDKIFKDFNYKLTNIFIYNY